MVSQPKDYDFEIICPWDRKTLSWGGLCSHAPLMEHVRNSDLRPDQLEKVAAELQQRVHVKNKSSYARLKANEAEYEYAGEELRLAAEKRRKDGKEQEYGQKVTVEQRHCCGWQIVSYSVLSEDGSDEFNQLSESAMGTDIAENF
ncbi:MAG: hypothetical protein Q9168_002055 [Polycauliona sp. 1 TL-2023]